MSTQDHDDMRAWDKYRPKPGLCPICKARNCKVGAKTCRDPKCAREYERLYERDYYEKNSDRIIANQKARLGSRATAPKEGFCEAPHPDDPDKLCGKPYSAKGRGKGRVRTCSEACRIRLRWAQQVDRYQADPQAKRNYKNNWYAENRAKPQGATHCPNPGCRRPYVKKKKNQTTCGRASCHVWLYNQRHPEKAKEIKRNRRRKNPGVDAEYQRNYRKSNPDKFKSYRPKINARQQQRRAAERTAAIAAGTFVDRRRKLTDAQRSKIIKRRKAGETLAKIAKSFSVSIATIARVTA